MKVLWLHNFDPKIKNSGVFMHQAFNHIQSNYNKDFRIEMLYLGSLRNPINIIRAIFKVYFLSKDYDLIHAQYGSMCGFISSFARGKKIITLRGSDWYRKKRGALKVILHNVFQNALTLYSLKRYDKIIVVSESMGKSVRSRFPNSEIVVIPSPIDCEKFKPLDKAACRSRLNMCQEDKIFLFPVMNALNSVKRPQLVEEVKKFLPAHIKIITATGVDHSHMCELYNAVDAVLLPSEYEGWPNVIKEALLCNVPFIATDVSDLRSISERYPSCKIVEPNAQSIYAAIISFESNQEPLRLAVSWMSLEFLNKKMLTACYSG